MASTNSVQQQQNFQQQQQSNNTYHCKDCGLYLNSAESLEVHVQYHKENLLNKWATQAQAQTASSHPDEANNNTKQPSTIKREFIPSNTVSAADSSDSMNKKSPEYGSRATPEAAGIFGHPPTPQSYQSASSPYQNNDNSAFSPSFQNYQQQVKIEPTSPVSHYHQNYHNFPDSQFFQMDPGQQQQYGHGHGQEYTIHKSFRYHPYQQQGGQYDRAQAQSQVSSSSPAYPPQPTPSPSPKQCDKCGFVCESASQLIEHLNLAHPPTPAPHLANYSNFLFGSEHQPQIKTEEDAQSEILDLDSHKVHQVYPEEEKRPNGEIAGGPNPHSVNAMLNSWPQNQQHPQPHQKMFSPDQHGKMFQADQQKLFQPHQMHGQEYLGNGVSTSSQDSVGNGMPPMLQQPGPGQAYRHFDHMPSQPNPPVISSTQVPTNSAPVGGGSGPSSTKSANWKSNEARRPKTYNCTACNKWFTSSGHLKRHYNTTLHKNAVKSSGQPDPATLPISAHHHPARDSSNRDDSSGSPGEEPRVEDGVGTGLPPQFDRVGVMGGLLQQPPNGPYDRQPPAPNIHHGHGPMLNPGLSNGSSPNGEAGPSPATTLDSRGLLLASTPGGGSTVTGMGNAPPPAFGMPPSPMIGAMDGHGQFQMYPNESAPHVTPQATVISSLNTTGEIQYLSENQQQPLPSFAQFQMGRMGLSLLVRGCGEANVGGGGTVTAPYITYSPYDHYQLSGSDEVRVFEHDPRVQEEQQQQQQQQQQVRYVISFGQMVDNSCPNEEMILPFAPSPGPLSPAEADHNGDDSMMMSDCETRISTVEDFKNELESPTQSPPESARFKRDYEDNISGASVVSSTVQVKQMGLHKCFECDKVFNKACYLTQHNKTFHSGDKPFKCTRCGKRFSSDSVYREHHSKHAGDKPHKCDLCPKQFNHKTDLRRHMCLHTGQKPYSCETCGKGFIRKDHMLKHCETHLRKAQTKVLRERT